HVAERGGEDHVVALAGEAIEDRLRLGTLWHALEIGRLDAVTQRGLELEAAVVVLLGPAGVTDRADVDERGLDRLAVGARFGRVDPVRGRRGGVVRRVAGRV